MSSRERKRNNTKEYVSIHLFIYYNRSHIHTHTSKREKSEETFQKISIKVQLITRILYLVYNHLSVCVENISFFIVLLVILIVYICKKCEERYVRNPYKLTIILNFLIMYVVVYLFSIF